MPWVLKIIIATMAAPKKSILALARSRNTSGMPMMSTAPSSTPVMLPDPPRMTRANIKTDSQKVKDSGATIVIFPAKRAPAMPAHPAPSAKTTSLWCVVSMPLPSAAISSSLI